MQNTGKSVFNKLFILDIHVHDNKGIAQLVHNSQIGK
jgi:hypothetical protein